MANDKEVDIIKISRKIALLMKNRLTLHKYGKPVGEIHLDFGGSLWINEEWGTKGRVTVRGTWPKLKHQDAGLGHEVAPSEYDLEKLPYKKITFSPDKAPEQMVKDITSRFLPGYEETYKAMAERRDEYDAHTEATNLLVGDLEKLCPSLLLRKEKANREQFYVRTKNDMYGSVDVSSAKNVEIHLRGVNGEQAKKILAAIEAIVSGE